MRFLIFLTSITVTAAVDGFEPGLRAKFGKGPNPSAGQMHFYDIPRTVPCARAAGWKCTRRPAGPLPQLVMYCPEENVVCVLYDDTDYIAGIQIALSKTEFSENVFDWEKRGFTSWKTIVEGRFKEFWTQQQFYVDDAYLAISREKRLATRDYSRTLQANAVWFTGIGKKLLKVSNQEEHAVREKLFLKQACTVGMGQHYYYNMSTQTQCSYDQMYPWFIMFKNGELSGTAFFTFGKLKIPKYGRNWFERPTLSDGKAIIPYGPQCLYDLITDSGSISLHFFLVDEPWEITCPA